MDEQASGSETVQVVEANAVGQHQLGLTIAYVGPFGFPRDDAPSRRVLGIAQTLRLIGCTAIIGSGQRGDQSAGRPGASVSSFDVHSLDEVPDRASPRSLKMLRRLTWGRRTLRWVESLDRRPDALVLYGGYSAYARLLVPWCRRHRVPMVVDVVEWYQPSHLPGGSLGPVRWDVELAMRRYYPSAGHIIAISKYLQRYYEAKGCRVVRIPPTLDVAAMEPGAGPSGPVPLTLAYTGVPGKKDLLNNVVEAVLGSDPSGERVKLVVAGLREVEALCLPAVRRRGLSALPPGLQTLGRVSHAEALDVVRGADFSVLLRPRLRYAEAGFPTKVAESLAVGTPVICNLTSDLGDYIGDGQEGLVCKDHTPDAMVAVLERALALRSGQKQAMRRAARSQAECSFAYQSYAGPLAAFLQEMCA